MNANDMFLVLRSALVRLDKETAAFVKSQSIDPAPGSQAAQERAAYPNPESLRTVSALGSMLLESIAEHASLLVKAMTEPIETLACWTCVRSMLESSAIAAWLLDPRIDAKQRAGRAYAHRYEGLEQQIKFLRSTTVAAAEVKKVEDRLEEVVRDAAAHGFAPVLDVKGRRIGVGQKMSGATDIIKTVLDEEMAYRLLSAVAHHHNWAILQLGFKRSSAQLPQTPDGVNTTALEKSAGSVQGYMFLTVRAAKALAVPLWNKCLFFGWDKDRLARLAHHNRGMDSPLPGPDTPLPGDVATLRAMVRDLLAEVARLRAENAELKAKLDSALKHRFGRRSERRKPPVSAAEKPPRKRDEHGRKPLPEHLERREVVHDLTEAERLCPCCGQPRVCIGAQTAEQLDLEPARFFVLRTVRKSYACRHCDPAVVPADQRLRTAGPAQAGPIPKGLCGPGLLAHAVTAKFADHVPLHRLAGQLARSGVKVARSTLGDWLSRAAELLSPLYQLMHRRVLLSRVIHGDDTGVKLRVVGSKNTKKAHLWVVIGDADYPYIVFDFTADYTADGPTRFLADYRGYLQADALVQYQSLYGEDQVKHVCCWAHARRKFVTAAEGREERANTALELIGRLYAIERQLPPLLVPRMTR